MEVPAYEFVEPGGGMIIGSVEGVHITSDTPMDEDQWEGGQPWMTKPKT